MNQIFSLSRFIKYTEYQFRMRSKVFLLTVAGAFVAHLFVLLFVIATNLRLNSHTWLPIFFMTGALSALIYIGNSFPYFRKKDTTLSMIMLPASVLDKFTYEYTVRVILFTLFYPLFFYLTANIAIAVVQFFSPDNEIVSFSFDLSFTDKISIQEYLLFYYISPAIYFLITSMFFAGAASIRKLPLIKTLVIIGLFLLSVFGYFYIIFSEMKLDRGFDYFINQRINNGNEIFLKFVFVVLVLSTVTILLYTYFKIKEKEV